LRCDEQSTPSRGSISEGSAANGDLTEAQGLLKQMVLDSVMSPNTRRSYALTLDELFAFSAGRPLNRALLQAWKASMDALAPSSIDVKLSAVRRLVGEARRNGLIGQRRRPIYPTFRMCGSVATD